MMYTLSQKDIKERDRIIALLREKESAIEDAVAEYNAIITEAQDWRDGIVERLDTYESERSDKWWDSDAASLHEDWKASFADAEIEEIEVEIETNAADILEELPVRRSE